MKKLIYLFSFLLLLSATTCKEKKVTNLQNLKAEEAATILTKAKDITLVDVRTPEEFKEGHIKGAKNIDVNIPDFKNEIAKLDTQKPIFVYCQSGNRSTKAIKELQDLGFPKIYHLENGISDWKSSNLPIEE